MARIAGLNIDVAKTLKFINSALENQNEMFFGTIEEVKEVQTQLLALSQ
jgi:hypothetical protein